MRQIFLALHNVAHGYEQGGVQGLAEAMNSSYRRLLNKLNHNDESHQPTLLDAVRISLLTNKPDVILAWAAIMGYACIPVPAAMPTNLNQLNFFELLLQIGESNGDVCSVIRNAWADQRITRGEAVDIEEAINQMICKLETLRQNVRSCLDENQQQGKKK